MKLSKNFELQEFVSKETYDKWGDKSLWFIDKRVVDIVQFIRDKSNLPVTVNNWYFGGTLQWRGYRTPDCKEGAKESDHKRGIALDINIGNYTGEQMREFVRQNWHELKTYGLTTIEKDTPTWLHFSCRWTNLDYLLEVSYQ